MSILETERLIIRDWKFSDWEQVQPLARDARVLRYIPQSEPWSDERVQGFVKQAIARTTIVIVRLVPTASSFHYCSDS